MTLSFYSCIYAREVGTSFHQKICIRMLIAALFIVAQMKTIQMSFNRRMDNQMMLYSCNGIIRKARKSNTSSKYKRVWMTLKNIMLSQRTKHERTQTARLHLYEVQEQAKLLSGGTFGVVISSQGWGRGVETQYTDWNRHEESSLS